MERTGGEPDVVSYVKKKIIYTAHQKWIVILKSNQNFNSNN
jgi:hypothetical protein